MGENGLRISVGRQNVRNEIRDRCVRLVSEALMTDGLSMDTVVSHLMPHGNGRAKYDSGDDSEISDKINRSPATADRPCHRSLAWLLIGITVAITMMVVGLTTTTDVPSAAMYLMPSSSRCLLDNNFLVRELTRPPTDCSVCFGVTGAHVLPPNVTITREQFAHFAYSGHPVLAKRAALDWPATTTFSFDFFKRMYVSTDDGRPIDGALDGVEDECQFFPFRTKFITLADVFAMPPERANGSVGQEPWYIGWSNCDPRVADILRKHYSRPHFLPADSESSAIDWIFMGWSGHGASVHLDYVQRPSWQAQISGRKTWRLFPVPECEHVCGSLQISVEKGDIVFIDTNQWYHDTFIEPGEMSITIGSEYD